MPAVELRETKARLREAARLARSGAFSRHGSTASERLALHGLTFVGTPVDAVVSGFSAIGEELDPSLLLARLVNEGRRVCLPVMQGKGLPLLFRSWKPGDPTTAAVWGISEPLAAAPELEPDVLLVPLLAFDARGYRLGYGGGFYDRTIATLRARKPILAIGVAFDEQRVDAVPRDGADQPLDWVLTPSGPVCTR
jgi:5-formyltetrahydrofolate cyclo-ligase